MALGWVRVGVLFNLPESGMLSISGGWMPGWRSRLDSDAKFHMFLHIWSVWQTPMGDRTDRNAESQNIWWRPHHRTNIQEILKKWDAYRRFFSFRLCNSSMNHDSTLAWICWSGDGWMMLVLCRNFRWTIQKTPSVSQCLAKLIYFVRAGGVFIT